MARPEIPSGLCKCGCGKKTSISKVTDHRRGNIKGKPVKYIKGHNSRTHKSSSNGYLSVGVSNHPRSLKRNGFLREHVVIAEKALGCLLPDKAEIHHVDGNKSNNNNRNLVICNDRAYHILLHCRTKALKECGNANWLKCCFCKKYDDPKNMKIGKRPKDHFHAECKNKYQRERRLKLKILENKNNELKA